MTRIFGICLGLLMAAPLLVQAAGTRPKPLDRLAESKASAATQHMAEWVAATGDNLKLPYLIIDKLHAQVSAFTANGELRGSAPALIGLAHGDVSPVGIGQRRLADIAPADRITPAGRFVAALGHDLGEHDVVWVDYDSGISLHRVVRGNVGDHHQQRLASATPSDNRITYGCINVSVAYFEQVVRPLLSGTNGMVYILPELSPLRAEK